MNSVANQTELVFEITGSSLRWVAPNEGRRKWTSIPIPGDCCITYAVTLSLIISPMEFSEATVTFRLYLRSLVRSAAKNNSGVT